ncbi:MAG: aldo/keto reductase [Kiloniellales bacterium]|nr:aldo/keto reductase [Kiloniellales bacterium]
MRQVTLPGGESVPALGQGTWRMGEQAGQRAEEVRALKLGLDLGLTLIDTAEMYGEGGAEEVVGEAIDGRRDAVFLVSKVYPHNASRRGAVEACERSLARLGVETLDLYLLHWRGGIPLAETVETFEGLKAAGKIRHWGVSNLDSVDVAELLDLEAGAGCATNQVLYHPGERGIEWNLLPACREHAIPIMAYSPLGQGEVLRDPALSAVAEKHGVTPAAVSLAWVLRHDDVIAIPKSSDPAHLRANAEAADLALDGDDLAAIDAAFPPPRGPSPLAII